MNPSEIFKALGLNEKELTSGTVSVESPIDGKEFAKVKENSKAEVEKAVDNAHNAFLKWREVPAPKRGELVRIFGNILREYKEPLGRLVTLECGKIYQEGLGEVQEMIDICDFAVGLSRQLYGLTIASERPGHRMMETWHPLGVVGVVSAFNFPVAVWAWNAALALVCGDPVVWKPSRTTPVTALACQKLFEKAVKEFGEAPDHLSQVVICGGEAAGALVDSPKVPLVSATGSCNMGRVLAPKVAEQLGRRMILELGGNNAMIVAPSADMDMALRAILFSAVGTAGQRCTSLRRIIVHESIYDQLLDSLKKAYEGIAIGDPLDENTLMGPLIHKGSYDDMQDAIAKLQDLGMPVFGGDRILEDKHSDAYYVKPAIAELTSQIEMVKEEVFGPLLYAMKYKDFDEAIAMHNGVPQGLSSCIFTTDVREAEYFLSAAGSDCGIANVNIGPSGAEIGGAFGGEKETGGGRESGSDSWKVYMRRATNTINFSKELPLAQGIKFEPMK